MTCGCRASTIPSTCRASTAVRRRSAAMLASMFPDDTRATLAGIRAAQLPLDAALLTSDAVILERSCLAVVPAYNEAGTRGRFLRALREHVPDFDVVVIDDGSTDS